MNTMYEYICEYIPGRVHTKVWALSYVDAMRAAVRIWKCHPSDVNVWREA